MSDFELAKSLSPDSQHSPESNSEVFMPRSPPHKAIILDGEKVSDVFLQAPF